jgi:hypothetical protein
MFTTMSSYFDIDDDDHDDDRDEHSACSSVDDALPFATSGNSPESQDKFVFQSPQQSQVGINTIGPSFVKHSLTSPNDSSLMTAATEQTAQGSSFFDSPMENVLDLTSLNNMSQESQNIEFEASSLLAAYRIESIKSYLVSETATFHLHPKNSDSFARSMGFSELMRAADDQSQCQSGDRLSVLRERSQQERVLSTLVPGETNHSWLCQDSPLDRSFGVSRLLSRGIQIDLAGEENFQISMQVEATTSEVLLVLGNPDLLQLWCDSVQTLVVTRSSDGAKSAINRRDEGGNRAVNDLCELQVAWMFHISPSAPHFHVQYDGEWVEASTSTLVSPVKGGYLATSVHNIRTYMGFPLWGKVNMFVERHRGQASLTIGPFAGGLTVFHTFEVSDYQGITSITDKVRVAREPSLSSSSSALFLCGICSMFQRCFKPSIDGHMDQVLASMAKLRVLVEHGEHASGAGVNILESAEISGVSVQPLLSS